MHKNSTKHILVTGGAGYIGSHMAGLLIKNGQKVVIFDNLSTGVKSWLPKGATFIKGDLLNTNDINKVFSQYSISNVIHFAAKIVVPESVTKPILYYQNNIAGTLNLLSAMNAHDVKRIVFSSTAAVYGNYPKSPITEQAPTAPLNPYGNSKLIVEQILQDISKTNQIEYIILRYFNVAGWDTQRRWPTKGRPIPTHLISNIMKALQGQSKITVCGNNYKTVDGTGVRDFIHVMDLAQAHLLAIKALSKGIKNETFNLGNGQGFSVMDIIKTTSKISSVAVPYTIGPRRAGDVACLVASSTKAKKILGWKPQYDLNTLIASECQRKY